MDGKAMKHLRSVSDLSPEVLDELMSLAHDFKVRRERGERIHTGIIPRGAVVAMIFEKPSLRTKVAFEVATSALEGTPVFLSSNQILASGGNQSGRESIPDIGRNLERFSDIILARVYSHSVIEQIANSVNVPVVNLLCDRHHPTQSLADLMAIKWHFPKILPKNLTVSFVGDGNNVATSLMGICALAGINFQIASPTGYEIPLEDREYALAISKRLGSSIIFTNDPGVAVAGADVVYTDTFVSMGQEDETAKRLKAFERFKITDQLLRLAKPNAKFMHCLPAHRGEEVSDSVMDSKNSIVFDQAECRLHIAKALLTYFMRS